MSKENNISKFDSLFKEGLENYSTPAPSFSATSIGAQSAGTESKLALGAKTIWIAGIALVVGVTSFFILNDSKDTNNPKKKEIKEQASTNQIKDKNISLNINPKSDVGTINIPSNKNKEALDLNKKSLVAENFSKDNSNGKMKGLESKLDNTFPQKTINSKETGSTEQKKESKTIKEEGQKTSSNQYITIQGSVCNGALFSLSLTNFSLNNPITWIINDVKQKPTLNGLTYRLEEKIPYHIIAYSKNIKVADTFIDMSAATAFVQKDEITDGVISLELKTSYLINGQWFYSGSAISKDKKFVYSAKDYANTPYFIAKNNIGCLDTFFADEGKAHFKFITQVLTPNNDGYNDTYEVDAEGCEKFNIVIRNAKNEVIYSSNNPKFSWNGTNQLTGNRCSNGWYTVTCTYKFKGKKESNYSYDKVWIR